MQKFLAPITEMNDPLSHPRSSSISSSSESLAGNYSTSAIERSGLSKQKNRPEEEGEKKKLAGKRKWKSGAEILIWTRKGVVLIYR